MLTIPVTAGLAACILLVQAYAQWGHLLPSCKPQELVAQNKAWENRPKEIRRCNVTLDAQGRATVDADGETLPAPASPASWLDDLMARATRFDKLTLTAPANTPIAAIGDWRIIPQLFRLTEFRYSDPAGSTCNVFYTKQAGCEHCAMQNAVRVNLDSLGGGALRLTTTGAPPVDTSIRLLPRALADFAVARRTENTVLPHCCLVIEIRMRPEDTFADWLNIQPAMAASEVKAVY